MCAISAGTARSFSSCTAAPRFCHASQRFERSLQADNFDADADETDDDDDNASEGEAADTDDDKVDARDASKKSDHPMVKTKARVLINTSFDRKYFGIKLWAYIA
jgi:hypothetical protein